MNSADILTNRSHPYYRTFWLAASLVIVAIVGVADYLTGFERNFFAFYLIPIIIAVWCVSRGYGIFVSALCAVVSLAGDIKAGAHYSSPFVPMWNLAIALILFFVVIWISARLRTLHYDLEERVRQRTSALHDEMQRRVKLEEEILSISEREQQRIGRDLHDSLCQHLTGVALAGEVLSEQMAAKSLPEVKAMGHIVKMVEGAIELTRTLARGLHPMELKGEGFVDALRELTSSMDDGLNRHCVFECESPVEICEAGVATHLYRIAQEALNNAVKHSRAREVAVRLETGEDGLTLQICDDGIGLGANAAPGMGLRTMAYRASVIGADFKIERRENNGTCVSCKLPNDCFN